MGKISILYISDADSGSCGIQIYFNNRTSNSIGKFCKRMKIIWKKYNRLDEKDNLIHLKDTIINDILSTYGVSKLISIIISTLHFDSLWDDEMDRGICIHYIEYNIDDFNALYRLLMKVDFIDCFNAHESFDEITELENIISSRKFNKMLDRL